MPRTQNTMNDPSFLEAALEGLEIQRQRIEQQIREVQSLLGRRRSRPSAVDAVNGAVHERPTRKRQLSDAARKRIAAAQKKRWAEYRKTERQAVPE